MAMCSSRPSITDKTDYDFYVEFDSADESTVHAIVSSLQAANIRATVLGSTTGTPTTLPRDRS